MNVTRLMFLVLTWVAGVIGILLNLIEPYLPVAVTRMYRYGKYAETTEHPFVTKWEVPKRWYQHFYILAAPGSAVMFYFIVQRYAYDISPPGIVLWFLDLLLGTPRLALATAECTFLAGALITLQCWKRLYETLRVNIFSDSKMNIGHYLAGHAHYLGAFVSIIGESSGFVRDAAPVGFSLTKITALQWLYVWIFLASSYAQLRANFVLRDLRRGKDKKSLTYEYKIPYGELFDYVSGALQLTEITLYIILSMLLWQSYTIHYVTLWVLLNQTECALLTHWWYQKTFTNYPKDRKALIPYLI